MMAPDVRASGLAAGLREEFDRAFAAAADVERIPTSHLLAVRIGGDRYAIPVAEITGLQVDRVIAPVPTMIAGLLGLAGIRGELVPVYSLATLIGYPHSTRSMRWVALCGGGQTLGLAFDEFERHLNLSVAQIATVESAGEKAEHIRAVARAPDGPRPVISIPSVVAEIARRCTTMDISREK
jgi:purine-binding chemotaxis protein CheW